MNKNASGSSSESPSSFSWRSQRFLPSCLIALGATLLFLSFFSGTIFQNKLLAPGDALTYSLSAFSTNPTLWLDTVGCGMPVAADPQYQMWYPLRLLCRALFDYNTLVVSAYVIAFCTACAFAFSLTKSRLAAIVGGLVYSMSGFMFAHLGHVTIIHAAAWLPLLLLAVEKTTARFKWYWLVTGEVAVAMCMLGGHSQILLMQLIVAGLFALFRASEAGRRASVVIVSYLAMCGFGLAITAAQIIPTLELATFSARADWSFSSFVSFSLPPRQLAQFFFPFLFCQPAGFRMDGYGQSTYFGEWSITELAGYVGILPVMFGLVALVKAPGRQKWFWLALAVGALIVTAGDATPLAQLFYRVPVVNHFRCPARYVLLFDLAVSVLAAFGVASLERASNSRERLTSVVVAGSVVLLTAASSFVWCLRFLRHHFQRLSPANIDISPLSNAYVGIPITLFILAISIAIFWTRNPKAKLWSALLLTCIVLELASFDYFCEWRFWAAPKEIISASPVVIALQKELGRMQPSANTGMARIAAPLSDLGGAHGCPSNLNSIWNLPSPAFYSPLVPSRMSRFLDDMGTGRLQLACRYPDAALDLAAVKYLIVPKNASIRSGVPCTVIDSFLPFDQPPSGKPRFVLSNIADDFDSVYMNSRYLPRLRLVPNAILLDDADALTLLRTSQIPFKGKFDFVNTVFLPAGDPDAEAVMTRLNQNSQSNSIAKCEVLEDGNTLKRLHVQADKNTLLVIADQYFPGWHVTVDGKSQSLIRANYAFEAVYITSGSHTVEMKFEPDAFKFGLCISVMTLLANIAFAAFEWKKWKKCKKCKKHAAR